MTRVNETAPASSSGNESRVPACMAEPGSNGPPPKPMSPRKRRRVLAILLVVLIVGGIIARRVAALSAIRIHR